MDQEKIYTIINCITEKLESNENIFQDVSCKTGLSGLL